MGARDKLRAYFIANVGKILTTKQLRKVAGISEYARRIRELKDDEGFEIKTHNDLAGLKPDEYLLESLHTRPVIARTITSQLRSEILERNGYTCQLCGAAPGDVDEINLSRKIRLHIDHILPLNQGGDNGKKNLRVLCSTCNHSKSNIQPPSSTALNIIAMIRKLPGLEQKEVYKILKRKFSASDKD